VAVFVVTHQRGGRSVRAGETFNLDTDASRARWRWPYLSPAMASSASVPPTACSIYASFLDEFVIKLALPFGEGSGAAALWPTAARGYRSMLAVRIGREWPIGGTALQT
jgi:hypothetical protein